VRTSPVVRRSGTRVAALAIAALAAIGALTGCQTRSSTAAYVGDQTITTTQLDTLVDQGLDNAAIRKAWSGKVPAYRRQVLDNAIYHLLVQKTATRDHLTVSGAEVSDLVHGVQAGSQNGQTLDSQLAGLGVAHNGQGAFFRDVALTAELAIQKGVAPLPAQYRVGIIELPSAAVAKAVAKQLAADPASYPALARAHPATNTLGVPVSVSQTQFQQAFGAAHSKGVKAGTTFALPVPNAAGHVAIVHIFSVSTPSLSSLPAGQRAQAIISAYNAGRTRIATRAGVPITVNPRFGTWNTKRGTIGDTVNPAVTPPSTKAAAAGR
jgi:hypothetical protein